MTKGHQGIIVLNHSTSYIQRVGSVWLVGTTVIVCIRNRYKVGINQETEKPRSQSLDVGQSKPELRRGNSASSVSNNVINSDPPRTARSSSSVAPFNIICNSKS